jgi:hypothetical protein
MEWKGIKSELKILWVKRNRPEDYFISSKSWIQNENLFLCDFADNYFCSVISLKKFPKDLIHLISFYFFNRCSKCFRAVTCEKLKICLECYLLFTYSQGGIYTEEYIFGCFSDKDEYCLVIPTFSSSKSKFWNSLLTLQNRTINYRKSKKLLCRSAFCSKKAIWLVRDDCYCLYFACNIQVHIDNYDCMGKMIQVKSIKHISPEFKYHLEQIYRNSYSL